MYWYGSFWIDGKFLPRPRGEWSTQHLADPVELIAGESTIRVSRFILNFERRVTHSRTRRPLLQRLWRRDPDGRRGAAEIPRPLQPRRFQPFRDRPQEWLPARFRLVVSPPPANTHRLIVGKLASPGSRSRAHLELRGNEIVPDELGDPPQPKQFKFSVLAIRETSNGGRGGLGRSDLTGSLANGGYSRTRPEPLWI